MRNVYLTHLIKTIRQQYNETIKSLQFCKLIRKSNDSAEEWMCRLRTAVVKCNYKEIDRQLNEQFIHGLNDKEMLAEIITELINCEENITIHSENRLTWAKRVKTQGAQMAVISSLQEAKKL